MGINLYWVGIGGRASSWVANYKLSPDPEQTYSIEAAISSWEIFYTELRVELTFINTLFIEGGIRTYITKSNSSISFTPQTSVYDWKLGLRFFDGNLEIGWWHRCFHPSLPYMPILQYEITGIEGGFDQIYILFRAETPLIRRK